jgi:predicted ATPase
MKRIVLTGGPCSGKTAISNRLAKAQPERFVAVPEAATQVYSAAKTRWDMVDLFEKRELQRRIYHLQIQQELHLQESHPDKILILDRGTLDGAAYWPDGPAAYWEAMNTDLESELGRYDQVIFLETAATIGIYDGDSSNPVRFEDARQAVENSRLLASLWSGHKNLLTVSAYPNLQDKFNAIQAILDRGF